MCSTHPSMGDFVSGKETLITKGVFLPKRLFLRVGSVQNFDSPSNILPMSPAMRVLCQTLTTQYVLIGHCQRSATLTYEEAWGLF